MTETTTIEFALLLKPDEGHHMQLVPVVCPHQQPVEHSDLFTGVSASDNDHFQVSSKWCFTDKR